MNKKQLHYWSTNKLETPLDYLRVNLTEDVFGTNLLISWFLSGNSGTFWILGIFQERIEFPEYREDYIGYQIRNDSWHSIYNAGSNQPYYHEVMELLKNKYTKCCPIVSLITKEDYQKTIDVSIQDSRTLGVDTPGCSCNHSGMGAIWHGSECEWMKNAQ